jgi:anaerobic magnesium-protoporphyrin IX monomethyl ester cyclase
MKVLFIYPESYLNVGIPGGIAIMSALLKQRNHQVDIFDTAFLKTKDYNHITEDVHGGTGLSDKGGISVFKKTEYTIEDLVAKDPVVDISEELQKKIDTFKPDIIAPSCMTSTFDFTCDLLRSVKHNAIVIVGGVHATIAYKDCLQQDVIDYAFVGEADRGILEFIESLEKNEDPRNTPGLAYLKENGVYKSNRVGDRICLDDLPCPDWGLFDERHLFRPFEGKIYKGSFYSQSRGCPMQCKYCVDPTESAITGGPAGYFRVQAPDITIRHLTELKEKYGATWYKFSDDTFLLPKIDHLKELAVGFKKLGIQFACSVMINTITEEKVALAKEMGCVSMSIGIEAGNPEIRESLNRKYSDEKLFKGINWMHKYGIKVASFNIIGCPGETRENVFETIELNRKLSVESCNVYIMFPYPGTPIQIESKVPIRDKNGRLHLVSEAKNLGISKMSPEVLEGLEKTFNIYLNLPKTLWSIIELAEKRKNWQNILAPLKEFSIQYISGEVEDYDLRDDFHEIKSRKIPKKLYEIYLSATKNNKLTILNSINNFLTVSIPDKNPADSPSISATVQ